MTLSFTRLVDGVTVITANHFNELQIALENHDTTLSSNSSTLSAHTANTANPHSVTKAQVGLGSVDNTADLSKPVSSAQQTALDGKAALSHTHTQAQSHNSADTDAAATSLHHTLGTGAFQAAAGNHTHAHSALTGIDTDGATTAIHHTLGTSATQAAAGNHTHAHSALTGIDTDSATTAIHHTLGTGVNQAAAGNHTHAHSALTGIDTDSATTALHHTLGTGANQAAAGNHKHTMPASGYSHIARSGGTTGTFNNTTATGTSLGSATVTVTGLNASTTYEVTGWGSAMLQSAASTTWVGCAVTINSTLGDFVGHKNTTLSATPTATHFTTVTGVTSFSAALNVKNDVSGTCTVGDASLALVVRAMGTN